jgi:predicted DNA-binding transcriptional regulator YafY
MNQHPAGIAVDDAACKLNWTVRTIWRDLTALQKTGFPLSTTGAAAGAPSGSSRRITLGLPVKLSLAETGALIISRDLLRAVGTVAFGTAVTSAFDKIGRALSRDGVLHAEKIVQASGGFTHAPEC